MGEPAGLSRPCVQMGPITACSPMPCPWPQHDRPPAWKSQTAFRVRPRHRRHGAFRGTPRPPGELTAAAKARPEGAPYNPAMQVRMVFCTCPDVDTAKRIADALVGEHLAACVNVLPGVQSVYRWQGAVERAD